MKWQGLRLGLVGPVPPPAGGMANQTLQLAELLRGEGVRVTLVQTNAPYRPAFIARVRGLRALFRFFPYLGRLWRMTRDVEVVHIMANSGRSWHLFAAPAVWVSSLRSIPAIVNYRGGEAEPFLDRSARWVRPTVDRAAIVVVPSGFLKEVFGRFGFRVAVVPNIIDTARFRPAATGLAARVAHIVVTRNLEPLYDIETALRAFQSVHQAMPAARMTVAGSGPDLDRLVALTRELGLDDAVLFAGQLDRDRVAELYRTANVALNPSRVDNMPNSVLEALASGVPVVSTRVGGVPHIVDDGRTALLVPPGDHSAMAAAILRLLQDPSLAESLVRAGLQEVQRYTWPSVSSAWLALYRQATVDNPAAEQTA